MKQIEKTVNSNRKERIEWFMKKLENVGYSTNGHNEYHLVLTILFDLSNKILSTYDFMDYIERDPELLKDINDNLLFDIALCLLDPTHLNFLFGHKRSNGEVAIYLKEYYMPFYFISSIANFYEFLTPEEKRYFGDSVSFIKSLTDGHESRKEEGRFIHIVSNN